MADSSYSTGGYEWVVQLQRPLLLEIACSPDSILTRTMLSATGGETSAERLSFFNGYDLGTGTGVRSVLRQIRSKRPQHV